MTEMDKAEAGFLLRRPSQDKLSMSVRSVELDDCVTRKYGAPSAMGPSPSLRYRLRFVSADDTYETLVSKLVAEETRWLDVGCGRDLFPSNYAGAKRLAERSALLVGVDPDENVHENDLLTDCFQGTIEDYSTEQKFDLLTMRMVAEHVVDASRCVQKLAELAAPGGLVVIYTPWRWAPMSLMASLIPFSLHNPLKKLIWNTDQRDTFPTAYKMNTRRDLQRLFSGAGFEEVYFGRVDDCSVLTRFLLLNSLEIRARNLCLKLGIPYPEYCLLAVFQRKSDRDIGGTKSKGDSE